MKIGARVVFDDVSANAVYAGSCAGLLAFSAVFVGSAMVEGLTLLWYDAEGHVWHLASSKPAAAAMDWYGRLLVSSVASALAAGVTWGISRKRPLPPMILRAAWVWALGMTLIGLFVYAWTLANRVILPPGA